VLCISVLYVKLGWSCSESVDDDVFRNGDQVDPPISSIHTYIITLSVVLEVHDHIRKYSCSNQEVGVGSVGTS